MGGVKIRLLLTALALGILGGAIGGALFLLRNIERPREETMERIASSPPPKPIDPGKAEFDSAMALIQERKLVPARDKLRYIIHYYPRSARAEDAKRVCGEINLDLLLSGQVDPRKQEVAVKAGDSLDSLSKAGKCSQEYIRRVNQLVNSKIQLGQKLIIRTMDFEVAIKRGAKKALVTEAGEFFREYDLVDLKLPPGVATPFSDSVKGFGGRSDPSGASGPRPIDLGRPGVAFRSPPPPGGPTASGIYLQPADLDELNLLLRAGAKVTFNP